MTATQAVTALQARRRRNYGDPISSPPLPMLARPAHHFCGMYLSHHLNTRACIRPMLSRLIAELCGTSIIPNVLLEIMGMSCACLPASSPSRRDSLHTHHLEHHPEHRTWMGHSRPQRPDLLRNGWMPADTRKTFPSYCVAHPVYVPYPARNCLHPTNQNTFISTPSAPSCYAHH